MDLDFCVPDGEFQDPNPMGIVRLRRRRPEVEALPSELQKGLFLELRHRLWLVIGTVILYM